MVFKDAPKPGAESASATLLFRVEETTSRSQFLAHFAFPSINEEETGVALKGSVDTKEDDEMGKKANRQ